MPSHSTPRSNDLTEPAAATTAAATSAAPPALFQAAADSLGGARLQRKIRRRLAARKEAGTNGVAANAEEALARADASSGSPLPAPLQRRFEASVGADLSAVRVHTGAASSAAAESVSARAYTVGNDIHFAAGQYDASSREGQHLLAHEVAHTVQQGGAAGGPQYKLEVSSPDDAGEHEADRAADAMIAGTPATVSGGVATGASRKVQRTPQDDAARLDGELCEVALSPSAPLMDKAQSESADAKLVVNLPKGTRVQCDAVKGPNVHVILDQDGVGFTKGDTRGWITLPSWLTKHKEGGEPTTVPAGGGGGKAATSGGDGGAGKLSGNLCEVALSPSAPLMDQAQSVSANAARIADLPAGTLVSCDQDLGPNAHVVVKQDGPGFKTDQTRGWITRREWLKPRSQDPRTLPAEGPKGNGSLLSVEYFLTADPKEYLNHVNTLGADAAGVVIREVPAEGGRPALPVGTYVHYLGESSTDKSKIGVFAYSGINKAVLMNKDSFRRQPGLRMSEDDKGNTTIDDLTYAVRNKPLWGPDGPQPEHALSQGKSGDCYFLAALASVCRTNPEAIRQAFNPQTEAPVHTVRLYRKDEKGNLQPQHYSVDSYIPTNHDGSLQYGGRSADPGIWVPLIEKAWAMYTGSYDTNGGGCSKFSNQASALEALTGAAAREQDPKAGDVMEQFRELARQNKAVTVGIRKDPAATHTDWTGGKFSQAGNKFDAQLDAGLEYGTIGVEDDVEAKKSYTGFWAKDDNNTHMVQQPTPTTLKMTAGSVDYQKGALRLTFDDAAKPDSADRLKAKWSTAGPTYQEYGLIGAHAYMFDGMAGDDAIKLKNPWGDQDPKKPLPAPVIREVIDDIESGQRP